MLGAQLKINKKKNIFDARDVHQGRPLLPVRHPDVMPFNVNCTSCGKAVLSDAYGVRWRFRATEMPIYRATRTATRMAMTIIPTGGNQMKIFCCFCPICLYRARRRRSFKNRKNLLFTVIAIG